MITRIVIVLALVATFMSVAVVRMTNLATGAYRGPLPALSKAETESRVRLEEDVLHISLKIGQRNFTRPDGLANTVQYLRQRIEQHGYKVQEHEFDVHGKKLTNLVVEIQGIVAPTQVLIIAAHYDSYLRSGSADASASGTAALLELLRLGVGRSFPRTVRYVFCVNGEPPWRGTEDDGSVRYAKACAAARESVVAAICLDSVGVYMSSQGSQNFTFPLNLTYPDTGDFASVFAGPGDRELVEKFVALWIAKAPFPLEAGAIPGWFPGVPRGAHESFAAVGIPAVLFGDTREQRFPDVGTLYDKYDRLDYADLARVVHGLFLVIFELSKAGA